MPKTEEELAAEEAARQEAEAQVEQELQTEDSEEGEPPNDETGSADDVEGLKKDKNTLLIQKKVYRDKLIREKKRADDLQAQIDAANGRVAPPKKEDRKTNSAQDEFKITSGERAEFLHFHSDLNLTIDDLNEIQRFAESQKVTLEDAIKKPLIKSFLKDRANTREIADGIPAGGARQAGKQSGKDIDYTNPNIDFAKTKRQAEVEFRKRHSS